MEQPDDPRAGAVNEAQAQAACRRQPGGAAEAAIIPPQDPAWPVSELIGCAVIALLPLLCTGFIAGPFLAAAVARTLGWSPRAPKRWAAWGAGFVVGLLVFVPGWAMLGGAAFGGSMDLTREILCASRLRGIGQALQAYEDAHGCPPQSLQVLVAEDEGLSIRLVCPATGHEPPAVDYFYYPLSCRAGGARLRACDLHPHRGRYGRPTRNVLFTNSADAVGLTEDEFAAELAKPVNASFALALARAQRTARQGP